MKHAYFTGTSICAIFSFAATSAFADLTADQVWKNWQDLASASGQAYTVGSETRSGDTLMLKDVAINATNGQGTMTGTIPEVDLRENTDGTVEVTMSPDYQIRVEATSPEGRKNANVFDISQSGLKLTAGGVPENINYDLSADTFSIRATDFTSDGEARNIDINVVVSAMKAAYAVTQGDLMNIATTFSANGISFQAKGDQEDGNGTFDFAGQMNDVTGASDGTSIDSAGTASLPEMLANGFATKASVAYQSGNAKISSVDGAGTTSDITTSSKGGNFDVSIDRENIAYGLGAKGVSLRAEGSGIPFPEVTAAYDEAALSMLLPVAKSDQAQDFRFLTKLTGLTVSDMIWGMIDPGATLPRTPATLIIDTSGKLKPLIDFASAKSMEGAMQSGPPAQIEALDVNSLQLTVAGAEFKGAGALTFDNTKPPMLGGVAPMPVGKLNLTLDGANALVGKLQTLGLVPPDFVMSFGMITSMLARPGAGPDQLVSEIEFTDTSILANGMPLPFAP